MMGVVTAKKSNPTHVEDFGNAPFLIGLHSITGRRRMIKKNKEKARKMNTRNTMRGKSARLPAMKRFQYMILYTCEYKMYFRSRSSDLLPR